MEGNIFEPQRVLVREFTTQHSSIDVSGSANSYITTIPNIDCRGFNLIKIVVRTITSGITFELRGGISRYFDTITFINADTNSVVDAIGKAGTFLVDVSKLDTISFYRNEAIATGTVTLDIMRCSTPVDAMPKVVQLATNIVTLTNGTDNFSVFGSTPLDISKYRFLSFRVKTVPLEGETNYKNGSVDIRTEFMCPGAKHTSYISCGINSAFTMQNNYVAISYDWTMIVAPFVRVYAKSLNSTAPTAETPEKYEVTLYGIR